MAPMGLRPASDQRVGVHVCVCACVRVCVRACACMLADVSVDSHRSGAHPSPRHRVVNMQLPTALLRAL
eukprot:5870170-Pleurochrysis_carterae.AAC.1